MKVQLWVTCNIPREIKWDNGRTDFQKNVGIIGMYVCLKCPSKHKVGGGGNCMHLTLKGLSLS